MIFPDTHQDNVVSDLADTFPWNDAFVFFAEEAAEASGTRHDKCGNAACITVEFNVSRTAQTFAGAGVDDFFLL